LHPNAREQLPVASAASSMPYRWDVYTDSGTEDVPLLLSVRSQSLILAAMNDLEIRANWETVDDADWDDIEKAIGEAYEEIMEVHETIPDMLNPLSITIQRNTNQTITGGVVTKISWNDTITASGLTLWSSGTPTKFTIPSTGDGYYSIIGTIMFGATTPLFQRSVRVVVNGATKYQSAITLNTIHSLPIAYGEELVAGDEIEIETFQSTTVVVQGDSSGKTIVSIARGMKLP